jgi:hypothetical protein
MRRNTRTDAEGPGNIVVAGGRRLGLAVLCGLALCLIPACSRAEKPMPSSEPLPDKDPVEFLEACVKHFDQQDITGYKLTLHKQERIGGRLQPPEVVELSVRERPRSIFMRWLKGARGADRALYVEGENNGKILVHPTGLTGFFVPTAALDPNSPRVRNASRFSIREVGLKHTLLRTLHAWRAGAEAGVGRIEYLGVVTVPAAGDRPCYKLRRTTPEPVNGVTETTVYIDEESRLQVGTVLKEPDGELVGSYFYSDIVLNPAFAANQFEPSALTE